MLGAIFEKLNDPHLVARFQNAFGVSHKISPAEPERCGDQDDSAEDEDLDFAQSKNGGLYNSATFIGEYSNADNLLSSHSYNLRSRKYMHRRTASEYSTASSISSSDNCDYVVSSSFFYYLFQCGAGLGNEMFYCCFFPYWFWNVDGYVCRRLVLTWCLIMYIGQALKDVIR